MKHSLLLLGFIASSIHVFSTDFNLRLGYNFGGTLPLSLPAEVRRIDSYNPHFGLSLGAEATVPMGKKWYANVGLKVVNLKMSTTTQVKDYFTRVNIDQERVEGYFTGRVNTHADLLGINLPIQAEYRLDGRWSLRAGAYLALLVGQRFDGSVFDGYQRRGTPTGQRIDFAANQQAHYDFSNEVRKPGVGLIFGADYRLKSRWGVYAEANWGLTGLFRKQFTAIGFPMYPIHGTFGVSYKL
ncbi:MAG: porin family protein [Bacteroides sp.]|nr:porin family protein [Bacteroides sp.]